MKGNSISSSDIKSVWWMLTQHLYTLFIYQHLHLQNNFCDTIIINPLNVRKNHQAELIEDLEPLTKMSYIHTYEYTDGTSAPYLPSNLYVQGVQSKLRHVSGKS